jgi:hypothetical protein
MAGHRDDGTFAEDKAHHKGRKVSRENFISGPPAGWTMNNMVKGLVGNSDDAPAHGIPRPEIYHEDDAPAHGMARPNLDEVLDPWDPEDIQEEQTLKEERLKKGHY